MTSATFMMKPRSIQRDLALTTKRDNGCCQQEAAPTSRGRLDGSSPQTPAQVPVRELWLPADPVQPVRTSGSISWPRGARVLRRTTAPVALADTVRRHLSETVSTTRHSAVPVIRKGQARLAAAGHYGEPSRGNAGCRRDGSGHVARPQNTREGRQGSARMARIGDSELCRIAIGHSNQRCPLASMTI
jgi:hypothetical protein